MATAPKSPITFPPMKPVSSKKAPPKNIPPKAPVIKPAKGKC